MGQLLQVFPTQLQLLDAMLQMPTAGLQLNLDQLNSPVEDHFLQVSLLVAAATVDRHLQESGLLPFWIAVKGLQRHLPLPQLLAVAVKTQ